MTFASDPTSTITVKVPDLGGFSDVAVIDVLVKAGDQVAIDTPLLTLESDKATMDVPSSAAGIVESLLVRAGDKVSTGTAIAVLRVTQAPAAIRPPANGLRVPEPYGGEPYLDTIPIAPMQSSAGAAPAPSPTTSRATVDAASERAAPVVERDRDFDLAVVGAGPGGYACAFRAADLGLKVALVERWPMLGGVCLNVGCIPSKALLHAAKVIEDARAAAEFGVEFGPPRIELDRLREWKDGVVARMTRSLVTLAKQRRVTVIHGVARFAGAHELLVEEAAGSRKVSFGQCTIAVGSESVRLPGLPEDPRIIDSTGALALDVPRSLLVIGGGIIGLEMATVYEALGARVSVVELTEGLMPGCDRDLVRPLQKRIAARYERIMLGTRVAAVEPLAEGLRVRFEGPQAPEPQVYDKVLVAVGRAPNGGRIDAAAAGVQVDERGYIAVDRQMRTNVPHIYAIGDVVGQPMLAHKATHEGKVAAEAAAGLKSAFEARVIPSVAYTDPEIAWVGLTETDARARGVGYEKAVFPWSASGRSQALGRSEGFTKLLFDPRDRRVLGGGIVGTNAGDLIAEVALAVEMGADAADVGLTIHPHPTLSETVGMAAETFEGTITDLYVPGKKRDRP